MSRSEQFDVVVVGGGLAGLAAGATAASAGASAVVLERHRPGGRARATRRDGFVLNEGAHALYVNGPGMAVLRSLGLSPSGSAPPLDRYRLLAGDRLHRLPSGLSSLLRTSALSVPGKVQLTRFLATLPRQRPDGLRGVSAAAWLADRDLRPDAEALVRALLRLTTYVDDLDEFGADAAVGQLRLGSQGGVLYLDGGWAQLVSGLEHLVEVRCGSPVRVIEASGGAFLARTDDATLSARALVIAPGSPTAARALLPEAPAWDGLGGAVTAACLDVGVRRPPSPGYVLSVGDPIFGTTQAPPARMGPDGAALVALLRYGARGAAEDRAALRAHLGPLGVETEDVIFSRFLPRMLVASALPRAATGGLAGRPVTGASGLPGVYLAGDWVGPRGWLADASLASGQAAGRAALEWLERTPRPAPALRT